MGDIGLDWITFAASFAGFGGIFLGIFAYDWITPETAEGFKRSPWIQENPRSPRKRWSPTTEKYMKALNIAISALVPVPAILFWWTHPHVVWGIPTTPLEALSFARDFVVSVLMMDFFYYVYHYAGHHGPKFLRKIHAVHHDVTAPRGKWAAYHIHPIDQVVGTLLTIWGCLFPVFVFSNVSAWALVLAVFPTAIMTVFEHSGRRVRYPLFFFDSKHHDDHHRYFLCDYAEYFPFWDWIFRTARPLNLANPPREQSTDEERSRSSETVS